ncbi:MAG TPA: hypothetical protein VLQ89_09470, partial [Candidatus Binatia bacterium]|nr:hypothetical protein [Candidatus Binatia bacterium]
LILALSVSSFVSCRGKSEKEVIAALVADLAVSAEKRDAPGLIVHLDPGYRDFEKRDREQTAALIEEYFSRYRGIVIHVLASRIEIDGPGSASLETDVSLSSGAAQAFRKLIRFSGENYRFRFRLRKDDRWRITGAEWEYVAIDGLFPESLKIFRELFPNL